MPDDLANRGGEPLEPWTAGLAHGPHDEDRMLDLAAMHVLGAAPTAERDAYRAHLRECAGCRRHVAALAGVAGELLLLPEPQAVRPELLHTLRRRLHAERAAGTSAASPAASPIGAASQVWKRWRADESREPMVYVPAADGEFEPTAHAGVEARKLFVDAANDRVTMLVRMAPGAAYPRHRHGGPEECFVLHGSIRVGADLRMRAGDYQRAAAGSEHPVQATEEGCLLLIVSSLRDELL